MKRLLNTLYVTNPDARLRKKDDAICVAVDGAPSMSCRFMSWKASCCSGMWDVAWRF